MPGYSISEKDLLSLDKQYLCVSCTMLLRVPVQTVACGHRYCKSCMEDLLKSPNCSCLEDGVAIKRGEVFGDRFAQREILLLPVHCTNHSDGCDWTGIVQRLEEHQSECPHIKIPCVHHECGALVRRDDLSWHLVEECSFRQEKCNFCSLTTSAARLKEHHKNDCEGFPVDCPKCSDFKCPRKELSRHLDPISGDCMAIEALCPFIPIGCETVKPLKRKEFHSHLDEHVTPHVTYLLAHVQQLADDCLSKLPDWNSSQGKSEEVTEIDATLQYLQQKLDAIINENLTFSSTLNGHNSRISKLEENIRQALLEDSLVADSSLVNSDLQVSTKMRPGQVLHRLGNQEAKAANHEVLLVEMNAVVQDQNNELKRLENLLRSANQEIQKLHRRNENLEYTLMLRNTALSDLEEQVRQQELTSFDGVFVWKITDFSKRKTEALTGKQASFYSPCFYTSRFGYKMCGRIYLNGDGVGKGTHISLFFVIMRGQYDGILRWPFRQKVTMMLLDQDNMEHVIDAFRPDPNSSSFQRPRREMNVASGCPTFCPLSEFNKRAYVKDDTMYIKLIVDTADLNI